MIKVSDLYLPNDSEIIKMKKVRRFFEDKIANEELKRKATAKKEFEEYILPQIKGDEYKIGIKSKLVTVGTFVKVNDDYFEMPE